VLATIAIFLPGFVLVAVSRPLLKRVRQSAVASAFLDGVNVAALALIAHVTITLARAALLDIPTIVIAMIAALLLLRWKMNSAWLILLGGIGGFVVRQVH
jgi:chromate transporter